MSQGRPYPRKEQSSKQRINEQIRISEVLVIDEKGVSRGVMPTKEAMKLADAAQLDLVEVAPEAKPPVCRILDYGKYKYQQNKKAKNPQSNQIKTKEIRLSPSIGKHDMEVRINQARGFINDKCKVQVTMTYSGREIAHVDEGEKRILELIAALTDVARVDAAPKRTGRKMFCLLSPLSIPKSTGGDSAKPPRPAGDNKPSGEGRPAGAPTGSPRPAGAASGAPRPPRPAGDRPYRPGGNSNGGSRRPGSGGSRPHSDGKSGRP